MAKIVANSSTYQVRKEGTQLLMDGDNLAYDIILLPNGDHHLMLDGKSYTLQVVEKNTATGTLTLRVNGRTIQTTLQNKLAELLKSMGMESGKRKLKELKAPMPGLVLNVLIEPGQEVTEGQEIMILEAMKMENAIKSPQEGVVESIQVKNQDKVEKNQVLITFA